MSDDPVAPLLGQREIAEEIESALDYSRRTLPLARAQMFSFENPAVTVASEESADPIVRLERKVESALRMIVVLQKKLDSIDAVLAKVIHRVP